MKRRAARPAGPQLAIAAIAAFARYSISAGGTVEPRITEGGRASDDTMLGCSTVLTPDPYLRRHLLARRVVV